MIEQRKERGKERKREREREREEKRKRGKERLSEIKFLIISVIKQTILLYYTSSLYIFKYI
jgi:hypothetical protein